MSELTDEQIDAELRAAGIDMEPANARLSAMVNAKLRELLTAERRLREQAEGARDKAIGVLANHCDGQFNGFGCCSKCGDGPFENIEAADWHVFRSHPEVAQRERNKLVLERSALLAELKAARELVACASHFNVAVNTWLAREDDGGWHVWKWNDSGTSAIDLTGSHSTALTAYRAWQEKGGTCG